MTRLYVGNLPYQTDSSALAGLFSKYGSANASVISDKATGRSKGFGFVEVDDSMAEAAIKEMNGYDMGGRKITVSVAKPMRQG